MNILSFLNINTQNSSDKTYSISGTKRDYSSLTDNDVSLKIWLPEMADISIKEMIMFSSMSKAEYIRQTLFVYLYGQYDLAASIERESKEFIRQPCLSQSISIDKRTPQLGKNSYDVKVMIASKMKNDLQQLANEAGIKLSEFIREVIISNLFGHAYLSERSEMVSLIVEVESE